MIGCEPDSAKVSTVRPVHVLTLTPFYPSEHNDAAGCFVAEPLATLAKVGVMNTVFALQPFYRENCARVKPLYLRNGSATFLSPGPLDYQPRAHSLLHAS